MIRTSRSRDTLTLLLLLSRLSLSFALSPLFPPETTNAKVAGSNYTVVNDNTFANMFNRALQMEFSDDNDTDLGTDANGSFNSSLAEQQAVLETVARVKHHKNESEDGKYAPPKE
ncbi:hypothetical protein PIB30_058329 [Stylosanthes scabra]|uniref:Uncharacterized protein n=1 Tax=Stylosanthes scabra TaxID=79078 RepID=A0ABU6WL26_9FABA|nr:hypothetical protein [Stylosanthes scabra]